MVFQDANFINTFRYKLTKESKDGVINDCRSVLYEWLKVGPFKIDFEEEDEDDWGSKEGCRIMGLMYKNGNFPWEFFNFISPCLSFLPSLYYAGP